MRGADRLSPDGIDRRAALRSQRRHRGGGELVLAWQARRRAAADVALAAAYAAARARFSALFAIMLGFLFGTAVGALAYLATGAWGLLLPLAIMCAIFAWARARPLAQD